MIHDQPCLNMIAIESRMQGDHEELKILLQNLLIASRFNRKFSLQGEEHLFIEKISRKTRAVLFVEEILDGHDCTKSVGHDPTSPNFSPIRSSSEYPDVATCHVVVHRSCDKIVAVQFH